MKQKLFSYNVVTFLAFAFVLIASMSVFSNAQDSEKQNIFDDADGDGLSNGEEKSFGTDPNNADTDNDSYSDGVEVLSGYDPLVPAPNDRLIIENEDPESAELEGRGGVEADLTTQFSGVIQEYVSSANQGGEEFLDQEMLDAEIAAFMGEKIDAINIPEIDQSRINIKQQDYDNLNEQEREQRITTDTLNYATAFIFIFENGFPESFFEDDDQLLEEVYEKAASIASGASSKHYFREINEDVATVTEQLYDLATPESMLDLHVEMIQTLTYIDQSTSNLSEISVHDESLSFFVDLLTLQEAIDSLQVMSNKWAQRLGQQGITLEDLGIESELQDETTQDEITEIDPRDQYQLQEDLKEKELDKAEEQ